MLAGRHDSQVVELQGYPPLKGRQDIIINVEIAKAGGLDDIMIKWCLEPIGSIPIVYSMMFSPSGAKHLSLYIQNSSFWSLSFSALSLFVGRGMNSRTSILKLLVALGDMFGKM